MGKFISKTSVTIYICLLNFLSACGENQQKGSTDRDRKYSNANANQSGSANEGTRVDTKSPPSTSGGADSSIDKPGTTSFPPGTGNSGATTKPIDGFDVNILSMEAKNDKGAAPKKGDNVQLQLSVKNIGSKEGKVKITPLLTSKRFTNYSNVKLATVEASFNPGETKSVTISVPNLFKDQGREYALGRGEYSMQYQIDAEGAVSKSLTPVSGSAFTIQPSKVVFTAIIVAPDYLSRIGYNGTADKFLADSYSEKIDIVDTMPRSFAKGFDEMAGISRIYKIFPYTWTTTDNANAYRETMGLNGSFKGSGCTELTHIENQGYDLAVLMNPLITFLTSTTCGNSAQMGVDSLDRWRASRQAINGAIHQSIPYSSCHKTMGINGCARYDDKTELVNGAWRLDHNSFLSMKKFSSEGP